MRVRNKAALRVLDSPSRRAGVDQVLPVRPCVRRREQRGHVRLLAQLLGPAARVLHLRRRAGARRRRPLLRQRGTSPRSRRRCRRPCLRVCDCSPVYGEGGPGQAGAWSHFDAVATDLGGCGGGELGKARKGRARREHAGSDGGAVHVRRCGRGCRRRRLLEPLL